MDSRSSNNNNSNMAGERDSRACSDPVFDAYGHRTYTVSDFCQNCLDSFRECDKPQRDVDDPLDPCSECRHFGGTTCSCTLAENNPDNVSAAKYITKRPPGAVRDPRDIEADAQCKPMAIHRIKRGWVGESRKQLLVKPDLTKKPIELHSSRGQQPVFSSDEEDSDEEEADGSKARLVVPDGAVVNGDS